MGKSFEEEILAMDTALHEYRERLRTDKEFQQEMENVKRYMFEEEPELLEEFQTIKIVKLSDRQGRELKVGIGTINHICSYREQADAWIAMPGNEMPGENVLKQVKEAVLNLADPSAPIPFGIEDLLRMKIAQGVSYIGIGRGGEGGSGMIWNAVEGAANSSLMGVNLSEASHIMLQISGDVTPSDAEEAVRLVREMAGDDAEIISSVVCDSRQVQEIKECKVIIVAAGFDDLLDFLSKDIRQCMKEKGIELTDYEKATLIYRSYLTTGEIHKRLEIIMTSTEDTQLKDAIKERLDSMDTEGWVGVVGIPGGEINKHRFENAFVRVPNPFERGDIVSIADKKHGALHGVVITSREKWEKQLVQFEKSGDSPSWWNPGVAVNYVDSDGNFRGKRVNPAYLQRYFMDWDLQPTWQIEENKEALEYKLLREASDLMWDGDLFSLFKAYKKFLILELSTHKNFLTQNFWRWLL